LSINFEIVRKYLTISRKRMARSSPSEKVARDSGDTEHFHIKKGDTPVFTLSITFLWFFARKNFQ
jgi:hypothetical protein